MRIELQGKTALVTGSTYGIGYSIAEGLHAAGAHVIVNGRSQERVDEAIEKLGGGDRLSGVAADVGTAEGCQLLVKTAPSVDILINNAGISSVFPVLEIPDSEWERLFAINVMSGVRLSTAYIPGMIERHWGRVIFISSESALQIPTEMVHYGMTKLSQLGVARGLAESIAGSEVTVNSVLPGPTLTPALEPFIANVVGDDAADDEEAGRLLVERFRPSSIIGRPAQPEEVANLVVYLSSEQASATTGSSLRVDGGVLRSIV